MPSMPTNETKHTNKIILRKGIKTLFSSVIFLFLGPIVVHSSYKNTEHSLFIPVLGLGIIFCLLAIYLIIKGLLTMVKALFD